MSGDRKIRIVTEVDGEVVVLDVSPAEAENLVRSERATKKGVDIRCPKPPRPWRSGTPGPCGRKLGELFPLLRSDTEVFGVTVVIYAPIDLISDEPPHWRILAAPSSGRFVEPDRPFTVVTKLPDEPTAVSLMPGAAEPSGGSKITLRSITAQRTLLDCPRCGATSDLQTLTGLRFLP